MTDFTWYLAQLRPNGAPRALLNLRRQGFSTFLPQIAGTALVRNRPTDRLKPLFPGYLFVQADPRQGRWTTINSTFGVARLVMLDQRGPTPVPQNIIDALMADCDAEGILRPPPALAPGDAVQLHSAAFFGKCGTVERLSDNERVFILLECMGRAVTVNLPRQEVKRVASAR
ncbi:MAG: transcriptional antiterminator [Cereibacter sp.]|jgi:transcriptional antiterminator RfaH|nr:transcriptional antiterminator [Cereibacter sp.]